jgi:hypothetical protein
MVTHSQRNSCSTRERKTSPFSTLGTVVVSAAILACPVAYCRYEVRPDSRNSDIDSLDEPGSRSRTSNTVGGGVQQTTEKAVGEKTWRLRHAHYLPEIPTSTPWTNQGGEVVLQTLLEWESSTTLSLNFVSQDIITRAKCSDPKPPIFIWLKQEEFPTGLP